MLFQRMMTLRAFSVAVRHPQITDYIYFQVTRYTVFDTDFFDMESWEATLWFFCTLINVCALVMSWVYTFDILQQETEALAAQEQVGGQRHAVSPPLQALAAVCSLRGVLEQTAVGRDDLSQLRQQESKEFNPRLADAHA
jgi:hypothetical protein